MRRSLFLLALLAATGVITGCSHQCKSNADCPGGDTCRAAGGSNNISPTMVCGPCVATGLACTANSDCCSGNCPAPLGIGAQVCKTATDAGPEPLDGGFDALD